MRFLSGCFPIGFLAEYGPKVSKGERREAGIQWIQPPKAVSDPGVQANNKRDARQCGPRRLFAPRKAPCLHQWATTLP